MALPHKFGQPITNLPHLNEALQANFRAIDSFIETAGAGSGTNTILSGSGAPSALAGSDGDFYIDTDGPDIYGPKASGAWGGATSLVGPTGPTGPTVLPAGEAWTTPTLGSGWSHYDGAGTDLAYGMCQYSKDPGGVVRLKGMVECTVGASGTIFTLPAGYRPAQDMIFDQRGNWAGTEASYRVTVTAGGLVTVQSTASAYSFLSLALEFRAEDWASIVASMSPVAWWRLGETSGTTAADSSGNGHDGTINGNPTLGVTGAIANDSDAAIDLDGTGDYITVPYDAALNPAQFTIAAWFKRDVDTGVTEFIVDNRTSTGLKGFGLRVGLSDRLELVMGSGTANVLVRQSVATISSGTWVLATATFDGTSATLFVNGVADPSASGAATYAANDSGNTRIGASTVANSFLNGKVDEVLIWNRALTAHEIAMLNRLSA